jgi:hypothetical protein
MMLGKPNTLCKKKLIYENKKNVKQETAGPRISRINLSPALKTRR